MQSAESSSVAESLSVAVLLREEHWSSSAESCSLLDTQFSSFVRLPPLPSIVGMEWAHTSNLYVQALPVDHLQHSRCFFDEEEDLDIFNSISCADHAALLPIIHRAFPFLWHAPNSPFGTQPSAHTKVRMHAGSLKEEVGPFNPPDQAAHDAVAFEAVVSSSAVSLPVSVDGTLHNLLATLPSMSSILHSPCVSTDQHQHVPSENIMDYFPSMHTSCLKLHNPLVSTDEVQQLMVGSVVHEGESSTGASYSSLQSESINHLDSVCVEKDHIWQPSLSNCNFADHNPYMGVSASCFDDGDNPSTSIEAKVYNASALIDVAEDYEVMMQCSNSCLTSFVLKDANASVNKSTSETSCELNTSITERGNGFKEKYLNMQEGYDNEDFMQIGMFMSAGKANVSSDECKMGMTNVPTNVPLLHLNVLTHHHLSTSWASACADGLKQLMQHDFSLNGVSKSATISMQIGDGGNMLSNTDKSRFTAGMDLEMGSPDCTLSELIQCHSTPPPPFVPADLVNLKEGPTQENELLQMDYPIDGLYKESILKALPDFLCPSDSPISMQGLHSTCEELGGGHAGDFWTGGLDAPSLLPKSESMASLFSNDRFLNAIAISTTSGIPYSFLPSLVCVSPDTSTTTGPAHAESPHFHEVHVDGGYGDGQYDFLQNHYSIDEIFRTSFDENITTQFKPSKACKSVHIQDLSEPVADEFDVLVELHPAGSPSSNNCGAETLKHINDVCESEILKDRACLSSGTPSLTELLISRRKAIVKALNCARRKEVKRHEDAKMVPSKDFVTHLEGQSKELTISGSSMHNFARSAQTDFSLSTALCLKRNRHAMDGQVVNKKQRLMGNETNITMKFDETVSQLSAALSFIVYESGSLGVTVHEALSKLFKQGCANLLTSSQPQADQVKVALRKCNNIKEVQGCRFIWSNFEIEEEQKAKHASSLSLDTYSDKYSLSKGPWVNGAQEIPSTPKQQLSSDAPGSSFDPNNEPRPKDFQRTDQWHCKLSKEASTEHCHQRTWSQSKSKVTKQLSRQLNAEFVNKHQTPEECENNDAKDGGHYGDKVKLFLRACRHRKPSAGAYVNLMTGDVNSSFVPSNKDKQLHIAGGNECPCYGDDTSFLLGSKESRASPPPSDIPYHTTQIAGRGREHQNSVDCTLKCTPEHEKRCHSHKNVGIYWQCARQNMPNSAYCEQHARCCRRKGLKTGGGMRLLEAAANNIQELVVSGLEDYGTRAPDSMIPSKDAGQEAMEGQQETGTRNYFVGHKKKSKCLLNLNPRHSKKEGTKDPSIFKCKRSGKFQQKVQVDSFEMNTSSADCREKMKNQGCENTRLQSILQKSSKSSNSLKTREIKRTKLLSNLQQKFMPQTAAHIREHGLSAVVATGQQNSVSQTTMSRAAATKVLCFSLKGKRTSSTRRGLVHARKQNPFMPLVTPLNDEVQDAQWCKKTDGRRWHCPRHAEPGFNYCEHHLSSSNKKKVKRSHPA